MSLPRPRSVRTCQRCGRGLNALNQAEGWQLCRRCLWWLSNPEPEPEPEPEPAPAPRRPWWRRLF